MTSFHLLVWSLTCLIWSTVWLFLKIGVRDVPPVTFAAVRLAIALAVLAPLAARFRSRFPARRRDYALIAGTGVLLLGVNYALVNWGIQFVASGLTAVLQATTPAFGMVFAHAMLRDERMTRVKVSALALGIGGVAIVFLDQMHFAGGAAFAGSLAVVAGAVFVAFAYVSMRRWGQALDPTVITAGQMAAAIVPLTAYAAIVEGNPLATGWTWRAAGAVLYLALFGSVAAGWLNYWLLKRIGATRLLVMSLVQPLVAVVLGALVLGERPTLRAGVGGVLILLGTSLALRSESRIPNPLSRIPNR